MQWKDEALRTVSTTATNSHLTKPCQYFHHFPHNFPINIQILRVNYI